VCAIGIFSKAPHKRKPLAPKNCYWVTSESMRNYYFAFFDHPLVVPHVYVNDPAMNATWISSALKNVGNDMLGTIAAKIVELRDAKPFKSLEVMKKRLEKLVAVDQTFVQQNIQKTDIQRMQTSTLKFRFFSDNVILSMKRTRKVEVERHFEELQQVVEAPRKGKGNEEFEDPNEEMHSEENKVIENKAKKKNQDKKQKQPKEKKFSATTHNIVCACAKSNCTTKNCVCKKNGVKCSSSCCCKSCKNAVEDLDKKEKKEMEIQIEK